MYRKLRDMRQEYKKTQTQLAKEAGISVRAYQKFESEEQCPNARTAIRIAEALGTSVEALWGGNPTR